MIVFSTVPTQDDAGQAEAVVNDLDTHRLLNDMLKELKKMNIHMSLVTDEVIENTEVEI